MADSNMQFGGWYANPAAGGQVQRYWNNYGWTTGSDPTQSGSSSSGSSSSSSSTGGGDYYSQALAAVQPQIQQAQQQIQASTDQQVKPFQDYLAKLPDVYAQKQTALQHQSDTTQQLAEAQKKSNLDVAQQTTQQLSGQAAASQGQQRAEAASRGIGTTSGVERSAEASVSNQLAKTLADLDTNTTNENTKLGIVESGQIQQISDAIAALPDEQAQEAMQYGSQIAKIRGEGAQSALSYTQQLMQMAATQAYQQSQLAMKAGDQQLAAEKLDEAIRHDQATEHIRMLQAGNMDGLMQLLMGNQNKISQDESTISNDTPPDFQPLDSGPPLNYSDMLSSGGVSGVTTPSDVSGGSSLNVPSGAFSSGMNFGGLPGLQTNY